MKKYEVIISVAIVSFAIIVSTVIYSAYNLRIKNVAIENEQKIILNKNKSETSKKQEQFSNIDLCLTLAKSSRESLWKTNCSDPSGSCTISNQNTINWIESRYNQDVEICFKKYSN